MSEERRYLLRKDGEAIDVASDLGNPNFSSFLLEREYGEVSFDEAEKLKTQLDKEVLNADNVPYFDLSTRQQNILGVRFARSIWERIFKLQDEDAKFRSRLESGIASKLIQFFTILTPRRSSDASETTRIKYSFNNYLEGLRLYGMAKELAS